MVRINQWNPNEEEIRENSLNLPLDAGAVPVEKAFRVGGQFRVEQVGAIELPEKPDGLPLGRCFVAKLLVADPPDVGDGSPTVKHADKSVSLLADAREFVVGRILQHVPHLAAKMLPVDLDCGEQSRPQRGHAVP